MKHVMIAGATGYLGQFLCAEYQRRGWHVSALVRSAKTDASLPADAIVTAEATEPETLKGVMQGVDLVVSALGITRQTDGLSYWDVDFQANLNLLQEALASGVQHFAYVHVLNADRMADVPLVAAKSAFVHALQASTLGSTIIAPSGYFSDMEDFLKMARNGRVWLFGDGQLQINPIHGADLASAIYDAVDRKETWLDVGGPDILTHRDLAKLSFDTLGAQNRVTFLPDIFRRIALRVLLRITPRHVAGPAQFFLTAFGMHMAGRPVGTHHLAEYFQDLNSRHAE
ncbi:SDR family oxidoreductase [Amaricoccus tamworthensis]|uniref:SDR family oxidoreductase n=1 Tax=Amaricoccus tamworthensis TaxID=57002 RepID=UPI003C7B80E6